MAQGDPTEPDFLKRWSIRSSNSRFFPAESGLEIRCNAEGLELEVTWENDTKLTKKGFILEEGALTGRFSHPKKGFDPPQKEDFDLVVTFCQAGPGRKPRLLGLLLPVSGGRGDEGTGVFVAEAIPRNEPAGEPA